MTNSTQNTQSHQVRHFTILDIVTMEVLSNQISNKLKPSFSFVCEFEMLINKGENVVMNQWIQGEEKTTKLM